jgi:hypothetical protein
MRTEEVALSQRAWASWDLDRMQWINIQILEGGPIERVPPGYARRLARDILIALNDKGEK